MKLKSIFASVAMASLLGVISGEASAYVTDFDFNMPGIGSGIAYGDQTVADQWSRPATVVAQAPNVSFTGYSGIQGAGSAFGFATSPVATDTATAFLQYYPGTPYAAPGAITLTENFNSPTATLTFYDVNRPSGNTLSFEVLQGETVLQTYTGASAWTENTLSFTPVAGEYISFVALPNANGDASVALTGVSVTAVPEPSTWAMMLCGFGLLGFAGYRRGKDRAALPA